MSIVSPLLDIFSLFPKFKHVGTCPEFDPEIDYEATAPKAALIDFPKNRKRFPVNDKNPDTNGKVPLHLGRPYDTQQFFAPISEGNKMGTPAEIIKATYLNQLMPTNVNMAARTNESGVYPYFMNELHNLENLIKNKPMAPEPLSQPDVVNPVEPTVPFVETPVINEVGEIEELEEMVKGKRGRGGAQPGAGRPLVYNAEEIMAKPPRQRTSGEKAFVRRQKNILNKKSN